jgi:hypothetical protein
MGLFSFLEPRNWGSDIKDIAKVAPYVAPLILGPGGLGLDGLDLAGASAGVGGLSGLLSGGGARGALGGAITGGLGGGGAGLLGGALGVPTGLATDALGGAIGAGAGALDGQGALTGGLGGAIGTSISQAGGLSGLFGGGSSSDAGSVLTNGGDGIAGSTPDLSGGGVLNLSAGNNGIAVGNAGLSSGGAATLGGGGASSFAPAAGGGASSLFGNTSSVGGSGGTSSLLNLLSGANQLGAENTAENQVVGNQQNTLNALKPFTANGTAASNTLATDLGTNGNTGAAGYGSLTTPFNPANLQNTPGYQFQLQQGNNALTNAESATGGLDSGAALKAAQQFGQGLAGTTYQNAFNNNLEQNAQTAQELENQAGSGLNAANITGNVNTNIGNAQSSGTAQQNNTLTSTLANLLSGSGTKTVIGYGSNGMPIYSS